MFLAIGTAHRACSLALIDGKTVLESVHEDIGRGHAERLVPMISELLGSRQPTAVIVEVGPGSFTGIRVGVAAARALGLAWNVDVFGMSSTALLAVRAFAEDAAAESVTTVLDGGRREVFVQTFNRNGDRSEIAALGYEDVTPSADYIIGNGSSLVNIPESCVCLGSHIPAARDAALLSSQDRSLPPVPLYIRTPDAKPSQRPIAT